MQRHCVIIGNGLSGAFLAVLLARDGWRVSVYERRGDPRASGYQGGRSINLALSARGLGALRDAGLEPMVRERDLIPMHGRMIHARDGTTVFQPYSKNPADAIESVSRSGLNVTLITAAAETPNVSYYFEHTCVDVDLGAGVALLRDPRGSVERVQGDLIVGADGAFSAVRGAMQRSDRFDYSQSYLGHGYKELSIAPTREGTFAPFALKPNALHIWPRSSAMMIALPNRDGSFTCTLFWPFSGPHSFEALEGRFPRGKSDPTREELARMTAFFQQEYADACSLMPTLAADFFGNPTSSLVTVRSWPWAFSDRAVLVGDAAHAIVPFYGQGINCGFEDCQELANRLRMSPDVGQALDEYQHARKPHADAIADMALENFVEMRDKVGRPEFLYRKRIEQLMHSMFPDRVEPQYNLVSFSRVPYAIARERGRDLDRAIDAVVRQVPEHDLRMLGEDGWRESVRRAAAVALGENRRDRAELPAFDISPPITQRLAVWPGDTAPRREVLCDMQRGDNITLSTLHSTVHLGAHADGPNHYAKDAPGIGERSLRHYAGPCHVWQVGVNPGTRVGVADIENQLRSLVHPRVLIRTDTFLDPHEWNGAFAGLEPELIEELAHRGVITIGIDTPSVDLMSSKELPAHQMFLRHDMAIIEGLLLTDIQPGEYELVALPLRLVGFDASPVRAILRPLTS